jgi:hypothetical protein
MTPSGQRGAAASNAFAEGQCVRRPPRLESDVSKANVTLSGIAQAVQPAAVPIWRRPRRLTAAMKTGMARLEGAKSQAGDRQQTGSHTALGGRESPRTLWLRLLSLQMKP